MAPSAAPAAALPQSQWPTPPSCPGSPLCDPATAADAATTSTATALVPGRAPATCDYTFHTTAGDVVIRAYRALSPRGADRLHTLVRHGYYDGSALYRVLPGFVAQFGVAADPTLARVYDYRANHPGAILEDEPAIVPPDGPGNDKLWLAYSAAYDERASPPRAVNRTAELFVNLVDNRAGLDARGFASFARVAEGRTSSTSGSRGTGRCRARAICIRTKATCAKGRVRRNYTASASPEGTWTLRSRNWTESATSRRVRTRPIPTRTGTTGHRSTTSRGPRGEGHGVLFYIVFSATLLMFFLLIRRQKTVSSKERRLS